MRKTIEPLSMRISCIVIVAVFVLRCYAGISILGSSSYTYDPRNPGTGFRLTCQRDNSSSIIDATWTRDGELVGVVVVQGNGRLALNVNTIGTEDPQSFEGLYRCHSAGETSDPIAFFGKASS